MKQTEQFREYRSQMNEKILASNDLLIKRIFNLDSNAFRDGSLLGVEVKELIGLSCSLVLRCDDCVKYHLEGCKKAGLDKASIQEAMSLAVLIGGTIVIPHLRRATEYLEILESETDQL